MRDRPAGICPDPLPRIAGAGRWPSPACVIRCALLPLLGPERVEARRSGDPILRWPRRCGADAAGRCMTGQRRAGPGSHRKRSAGAVSGLPGSSGPGTGRTRPAICWRATTARIPEWAARSGTPQRTHASAMSGVGRSANAPGMATSRVQYPAPPAARVCGPGRAGPHDPTAARTAATCACRRPEATPCYYPIRKARRTIRLIARWPRRAASPWQCA